MEKSLWLQVQDPLRHQYFQLVRAWETVTEGQMDFLLVAGAAVVGYAAIFWAKSVLLDCPNTLEADERLGLKGTHRGKLELFL